MNSPTPAASESSPSSSDTDALTGQLPLPGGPGAAANRTTGQRASTGGSSLPDIAFDDDEYEPV